ncbi:predicted protein [Nematostella vectensis]|uniref:G-protein coupled receptors family 1 profile domain-containing protein n=1 Tax=Nematostella vectensis TaxID=45351 RepID=A7SVR3_NEMVE|nr:octopamine receptor 1 [Nematostella vectensis]XP_032227420.1 octopamine receptor 1 [Nematostella vectensis]XP_032227422.1 octopamine receptor 1 [Nematostella vectensis]XP_032227423.1 octopamine receptor 1 [Nematostella vectensis]XP_032227425.1 octopamine receptor 1 [Nematostella vectensis]XP_048578505.1 octopamine receptor 1 [Nematostella vectensis]EDO32200.1 predicted protein [Nematostella vectensis]|eukprot:XP_001624300.1 predicted protein [Nematostella vectensis]
MSEYDISVVLPLSILAILVIVANTGVCVLVYKVKTMRTYTNGFVASLAVSDILTGIGLFLQYNVELQNQSKIALNIIYALVLFCGVSNLCAVTFDRYLAVLKPFKYQAVISKFFKAIIPVIWLVSLAIALLPALAWHGEVKSLVNKVYIFITFIVCAILPFFFIMYAHVRIYMSVHKCVQKERKLSLCATQAATQNARERRRQMRKLSSEAKVAKVFAIAAIMFILSWFPVLFYTIAAAVDRIGVVPPWIFVISPFTLALGSLVNPVLYSFMKPDFRRALKKMWGRRTIAKSRSSFRSYRSSNVPSVADLPNGQLHHGNHNINGPLFHGNNNDLNGQVSQRNNYNYSEDYLHQCDGYQLRDDTEPIYPAFESAV